MAASVAKRMNEELVRGGDCGGSGKREGTGRARELVNTRGVPKCHEATTNQTDGHVTRPRHTTTAHDYGARSTPPGRTPHLGVDEAVGTKLVCEQRAPGSRHGADKAVLVGGGRCMHQDPA